MSATEVIREIKKLPVEEKRKILSFLEAEEKCQPREKAEEVSAEFKAVAGGVFSRNVELFRKLAQ